jgi:trans-aconitate methyltransferase
MSDVDTLLHQATNPLAYDAQNTDWVLENGKDSPRQDIYREYFEPYSADWVGKSVVDVGSGAGWLLNYFKENGAASVVGIEPSAKNVDASAQLYPDITVHRADLLSYRPDQQYDLVTCVMVLTNVLDLEIGFKKLRALMATNAHLMVVVPDFEYFRQPRHNYKLTIEDISSSEYVIETERPTAVLTDIVRKNERYIEAATAAGLQLIDSTPIVPSMQFTGNLPQYQQFAAQPIMHLLRFR